MSQEKPVLSSGTLEPDGDTSQENSHSRVYSRIVEPGGSNFNAYAINEERLGRVPHALSQLRDRHHDDSVILVSQHDTLLPTTTTAATTLLAGGTGIGTDSALTRIRKAPGPCTDVEAVSTRRLSQEPEKRRRISHSVIDLTQSTIFHTDVNTHHDGGVTGGPGPGVGTAAAASTAAGTAAGTAAAALSSSFHINPELRPLPPILTTASTLCAASGSPVPVLHHHPHQQQQQHAQRHHHHHNNNNNNNNNDNDDNDDGDDDGSGFSSSESDDEEEEDTKDHTGVRAGQQQPSSHAQYTTALAAASCASPLYSATHASSIAAGPVRKRRKRHELHYEDIKIDRKIGEGSFGHVYKGYLWGQEVAVKKLRLRDKHTDDTTREDFLKEVKIMRNLRHPNIVEFLGATFETDRMCIVTEFLPGGSLEDVLEDLERRGKKLSPGRVIQIAKDVARGLNWLHHKGIIHRDLKPANLLVDTNKRVKLADFGLSHIKRSRDTLGFYGAYGTPCYMAPEVIERRPYSFKADVFSFSIVLVELVTGVYPYDGAPESTMTFERCIVSGLRPDLPTDCLPEMQDLIARCWAEDPDDRPDVDEVIHQLFLIEEKMRGHDLFSVVDDLPDDAQHIVEQLQERIATANTQIEHLTDSLAEYKQRAHRLTTELSDAKAEKIQQQHELMRLSTKLKSRERENATLARRVATLQRRIDTNEQKYKEDLQRVKERARKERNRAMDRHKAASGKSTSGSSGSATVVAAAASSCAGGASQRKSSAGSRSHGPTATSNKSSKRGRSKNPKVSSTNAKRAPRRSTSRDKSKAKVSAASGATATTTNTNTNTTNVASSSAVSTDDTVQPVRRSARQRAKAHGNEAVK
jgi:serine/threonine protein kinase